MVTGTLVYFFFAKVPFLAPAKPAINGIVAVLTPLLIFAQLLLTFCKVEMRDLKPKAWHGWLILIQLLSCLLMAILLVYCPMNEVYHEVFEAAMVCLICPTATAAAVITGKLGGSASSLTTYTLLSNLLAAVAVPLVFPWVEPHADISFWTAFLKILSKVFPLLICPFLLAWLLRAFVPKVHAYLLSLHDAAFYLWGVALAIVSGQTVRFGGVLPPVLPGQADWRTLPGAHQRRAGAGAEEHGAGHLDGLYLPEPAGLRRPRLVCVVAEHHQQLAIVEEAQTGGENKALIWGPGAVC